MPSSPSALFSGSVIMATQIQVQLASPALLHHAAFAGHVEV